MKKSKILSLALTLALVFTTVFAGTESIFAGSTVSAMGSTVTALEDVAGTPGSDTNPIIAKNMNVGNDADTWSISYSKSAANEAAVKIPKAGVFVFNIQVTDFTRVTLYDSPDPSAEPVAYQDLTSTNQTLYFEAKKAGVYYLAFNTSSTSNITAKFNAYYVPAGDATLSVVSKADKPFYLASSLSSTKYYRYKVKTTKTGYLTVDFSYLDTNSTYTVRISNSKKKVISGATKVDYNKGYTTYAGLPKGTYYVEVKTADPMYGIKVTAKYPTENSGSTRSKAKLISKGITKKGIVTATQTNKTADWYKIKLNGNQPVSLNINTKTGGASGGIRVYVYSGNKTKAFATIEHFYGDPSGSWNLFTTINGVKMNYLQKGTYYIKVTKYGSGNGYYDLSWQ